MDEIRIPRVRKSPSHLSFSLMSQPLQVSQVLCTRNGSTLVGTIHLTRHHLIFNYDEDKEKELWASFVCWLIWPALITSCRSLTPLISLVTRLPQTHQGQTPLSFHTRTFETFSFGFSKEADAVAVFDNVKELTVATSVEALYAFSYSPNPPLPAEEGWGLYSPRDEFGRMGVGTRTKAWRFTDINKDYSFSPTYPAKLVVPTRISDTTLQYASKYRSKARVPALTYLHWANYGSITRSSQPMVGITQNRSIQDEKLIESVFQTHHSPESRASAGPVYGATTTNLIIDARPTINAVGNTAKGAGTENMDHYKDSKKVYLGIDSIHVMRESLAKVVEALREADVLLASINNDLPDQVTGISVLDRQALRRSGWLRHIQLILEGTVLITRNIHINSSHVLIHCSDGWDRTSQLSALAQMCLDPFYRTIRGFEILIDKDWVSFGHKFMDRCGHLSSDKFFVSPAELGGANTGAEAAQAFLASMQNRFTSNSHLKETSPTFHQFLETVRQIQRQFPERFEFNERFLQQLYYHLYSCQFGTFLYNCERERRVGEDGLPPSERTKSVWDFLNSPAEKELNTNPTYNPTLDDPASRLPKADMGVLIPNAKDVRFWNELYGRSDEEMNGRVQPQILEPETVTSPDDETPIQGARIPLPPSPSMSPAPLSSQATSRPVTPTRPSPSRPDSFRPISSVSAFSLQGFNVPNPIASLPAMSSSHSTPKSGSGGGGLQPNFFANTGKSVWGRLSSNASAAFSAVQDAYVNASKDLNTSWESKNETSKTAELSSRETLKAWGEEEDPMSSSAFSSSHNPWGSNSEASLLSASTSRSSIWDNNPWGSSSSEMNTPTAVDPPAPITVVETGLGGMTLESVAAPTTRRDNNNVDPLKPGSNSEASSSRSDSNPWGSSNTAKTSRVDSPAVETGLGGMILESVTTTTRKVDPPKPPQPVQSSANIDPLGVGFS
ncbi:Phosphatases II [Mycena indigotica]|uniref:Phosphatases II n=1 Tax=Mycena indigotica TaxID=2126181 RepID=A0A8H6SCK1_9AGAR|nr:Phosphatases II [Mycena indigotica]KAF7295375.1 Phosphatases II [Mycena indigotica]